jgi:hypothetical protein
MNPGRRFGQIVAGFNPVGHAAGPSDIRNHLATDETRINHGFAQAFVKSVLFSVFNPWLLEAFLTPFTAL